MTTDTHVKDNCVVLCGAERPPSWVSIDTALQAHGRKRLALLVQCTACCEHVRMIAVQKEPAHAE